MNLLIFKEFKSTSNQFFLKPQQYFDIILCPLTESINQFRVRVFMIMEFC